MRGLKQVTKMKWGDLIKSVGNRSKLWRPNAGLSKPGHPGLFIGSDPRILSSREQLQGGVAVMATFPLLRSPAPERSSPFDCRSRSRPPTPSLCGRSQAVGGADPTVAPADTVRRQAAPTVSGAAYSPGRNLNR